MTSDSVVRASAADIAAYQDQGYIQYKAFFSSAEMDRLREAIDAAIAANRARIVGAQNDGRTSEEYEKVFNQMVNLWVDSPEAKQFSFSKRLAETGRQLSGSQHVRIYHDHAMIKPAGQDSRATNWHQDAPYWPMEPACGFSAWIAVDDVTIPNGCLHFVPGSHKFGLLEPINLGLAGDSIVDRMRDQGHHVAEPVAMEMEAGGVTFHDGCNFHYAGPNLTDNPRRAHAIIYIPDDTKFTGGKDAAGAAEEMTPGNPWDHPLHPILASEA
ncbi:MAG: phytanoyl-CoA dioxygenase family protein [Gemmatimonadetes bacterium]|nr:phytanoyl-CoA dioxygenase family protein [Gemmatimonadota bacterium]MBT6146018.1 phytanoyl-CoA dioxygenase family protein [Gemmatimonadota bacterium]MBT7863823.1 phytanoyl-CoA dioxygenase family protein [Gemmatimonadota bacterium]